jgi:hypothetical protein
MMPQSKREATPRTVEIRAVGGATGMAGTENTCPRDGLPPADHDLTGTHGPLLALFGFDAALHDRAILRRLRRQWPVRAWEFFRGVHPTP